MSSPEETFSSLGLEHLIDERAFTRDAAGTLLNPAGLRVTCVPREFLRSLRLVLEKASPTAWPAVHQRTGRAAGNSIAAHLDRELTRLGKPALNALPLEACLVLIERYLALHGWGRIKFDLADADAHGLVIARLDSSCFAAALDDVDDFVDPLLAGWLQGFFEHLTGHALGCAEIACVRRGAPQCVFVLTAPERLEAVAPLVGRESAGAIVARLKT